MMLPIYKISMVLLLFLFTWKVPASVEIKPAYNFKKPDHSLVLPDTLREVSGLTAIGGNTFACVQDENGILFIYDVLGNKIKKQFVFNIDGDYEGVARVGNTMFVLRSDGVLFEIPDFTTTASKIKSYTTGIPANNNEGLCYDKLNNRLLIACKSNPGNGPEFKNKRAVYGFDLKTRKLNPKPVLDIDISSLTEFCIKNNIQLPSRSAKNGKKITPVIKFRPSAICIHPFDNKLYLLSAADYLLFIFDVNGRVEHVEQLNPAIFNKAEGITFFDNGDMLITNEAQNKQPTLLRFNYRGGN